MTRIPIEISVDPGVEGVANLSGIQTGTPGDKVASFDVQIDATVAPDYFYIYFKNAETGEQLGAIPVFFKGDGLYVYDVEAYDPDFDELSYSLTTAPNGMWLEPTTGLILWSPNYGDQGEHNVTVEVSDGRGGVASQTFVVSVIDDANVAPTIVSKPTTEIYVETQNDGLSFEALYEYDCEALDQDGDALTYALLAAPEGMRIDAATGVVSWTVGSAEVGGEYEVSVQVADGRGGVDVQTFALNVRERSFGTVVGTVYEDANENGRRDSTLVPGDEPLVVFVVDTSGSMGSGYSYSGDRVGDLNNSGADTRIDAVIYAMSQYRQSLVDKGLGDAADLALIDFSGTVRVNDMNPVEPGVQLVASADADEDGDGVPDFMEAAYKLNAERSDGTNYSVALNQAISLIQTNGELDRETLVVFISDGTPNRGGTGANYADQLRQMGATVCAFGVGTGSDASLQGIQNVDANGVWFDNMNDLRDVFAGLKGATVEYSETGLDDWTVYVDVNNDGAWTSDEPSATTDVNGVYELTDVPTGEYTLRAVRKNEWLQSQPLDDAGYEIVVERGKTVRGKEFGFYRQGAASISGRLLLDENGDGVQDANETTGLANQLVWLDQDGDGMLGWNESSALTDENGFYLFENLPAGEYRVRYQPAYGFAQTYPVDGEWSVEDNLIVNGDFEDVIAFGGNVYEGRAGESAIVGWEITSGSVTIHTPSHNEMYDGVYCVDLQGLAAGSIAQTFATVPGNRYTVQYVVAGNTDGAPSLKRYAISNGVDVFYGTFDVSDKSSNEMGWEVRTWNFVAATEKTTLVFSGLDSTPYGASIDDVYVAPTTAAGIPGAHTVVLSAGQDAKDRDFGAYKYANPNAESGVSGRVFDDRNRNGAQDPGEKGLANRVVWLDQNKNDVLDENERVATTDENGDYAFENLLAGEYRVVLAADETRSLQTFPSDRLWDASAENLVADGAFDGEYGDVSDAVSQTFATVPGTRYVVQYSVAGNGASNVARYAITAGSERCDGVFDASTTNAAWAVGSWSFVATSTETTLTFAGANEASSAALIEGVRVVPASAAASEIGGWTVVLGASHWAQNYDFGVYDLTEPRPTLDVVSVPSETATEGVAYRYDVEAVDSENEKLTYSLLVAPEGMTIHPELGVVVWTPSANDLGARQVVVTVKNESGLTASQAFEILVSPANRAPILITESVPTPAFVDSRYEVDVDALDPDGDVLTYSFDAERGGT
ncbi:MAG: DUF642 domain-containing protein, partial [Thermoguttaceae bacterium]|nr:DUF642 domain-containing protein [Thermoguttaceae bacterium]